MSSIPGAPIREMFNSLVPEYDRFNRISSLGLDASWRRELVRSIQSRKKILDIGTGTGDVVKALIGKVPKIVGIDFSESMVAAARSKLRNYSEVSVEVGRADKLPFESHEFDGVTSAFVIRNLNKAGILTTSFREALRVLEPKGRMVHLELTRPPGGIMKWGHQVYLRSVLPVVGKAIFKNRWPQNYLSQTIQEFPIPQEICQRMRWAGFTQVSHYPLSSGIASLFCAVKP